MRIIMALILVSALCLPLASCVDEDKITDFCEEKIDEVADDIWKDCTTYYEEEILPNLQEQIAGLVAVINALLIIKEDQTLIDVGCVRDPSSIHEWDCTNTDICHFSTRYDTIFE